MSQYPSLFCTFCDEIIHFDGLQIALEYATNHDFESDQTEPIILQRYNQMRKTAFRFFLLFG